MKRSYRIPALLLTLALLRSGCISREVSEMFSLPQPPEAYQNLNAVLERVARDIGGESIAPQSGTNTQTVQIQDLDGDGVQESAVAFFRVSGAEQPLMVYILRMQGEENYRVDTVIEGVGTAINSVAYENVGGSPRKEVVVSWQISPNDNALGVYSLDEAQGIELLWVDSYTRFCLADMDDDGEKEVAVISLQTGEETLSHADYYDYDGAALALRSAASLSAGINEIKQVRSGGLVAGVPAIFVTSSFGESNDQVVDILTCQEGGVLSNVTLNSKTLRSESTVRSYNAVGILDINSDGITEVPHPVLGQKAPGAADDFWFLNWRQFDEAGKPHPLLTTFHNVTDGWYFQVPGEWERSVTISRKDSLSADERAVIFSLWRGAEQDAVPFLVLYKFTGANQGSRAGLGNRVSMFSDTSATYAYEFFPETWNTGFDHEEMLRRFHVIRSEWSNDN